MLSKWFFISLKLFIVSVAIKADGEDGESCNDVEPMEIFDNFFFVGEWYAYARMDDSDDVDGQACLKYVLLTPEDEKVKGVRLWRKKSDDSTHMQLGSGKLNENGQGETVDGDPLAVVAADDDYEIWALVLGCKNDERLVWILTREQNPDEAQLDEAKQILKDNDIYFNDLSIIDHSDCPNKWTDAEREEKGVTFEEVEGILQFYNLI